MAFFYAKSQDYRFVRVNKIELYAKILPTWIRKE